MMSAVGAAILTGGIVAGSNVVAGKPLTARQVIGTGMYAIGLAAINEVNAPLAGQLGVLVLVTVLLTQLPTLMKASGFSA